VLIVAFDLLEVGQRLLALRAPAGQVL